MTLLVTGKLLFALLIGAVAGWCFICVWDRMRDDEVKVISKARSLCHCGRPLHYLTEARRNLAEYEIKLYGEYVTVGDGFGRRWRVQRHWLKLHEDWKLSELKTLGFEEIK